MTWSLDGILLIGGLLLVLSALLSRSSGRTGMPALLLFMLIGILAGSEGIGRIDFENYALAQNIGIVSLIYILFAGGLDAKPTQVKGIVQEGALLATLGVLITAVTVGCFSYFVLDFHIVSSLLLGAIVSSTDAAAVFTVLRSKGASFKGRLGPLLELESGSNDPMAVLLTTALITAVTTFEFSAGQLGLDFSLQVVGGTVLGISGGWALAWIVNHIKLEYEGLYPVLSLAMVAFIYGLSERLGGNGILAVYLAGLSAGVRLGPQKRSLLLFHDGIAWLSQIVMFLVLGLLVFPSRLVPELSSGLLLTGVLVFIARPAAVFLCLWGRSYTWKEKLFISWVGLRGSVPIILATFPIVAGLNDGERIFNLVFFVVVVSVAVQGSTVSWLANKLGLQEERQITTRYPIEFVPNPSSAAQMVEIRLGSGSPAIGQRILDLKVPSGALIVLVGRQGRTFVPTANTELVRDDTLLVLAEPQGAKDLRATCLGAGSVA